MKTVFLGFLLFSIYAKAQQLSVVERYDSTFILCQQSEGDQWIEVGLKTLDGVNGSVQSVKIVEHNTDDESRNLIFNKLIKEATPNKDVSLVVDMIKMEATLTFKRSGSDVVEKVEEMSCYLNKDIYWDQVTSDETLLSIGR